jgi:hypothetical protein
MTRVPCELTWHHLRHGGRALLMPARPASTTDRGCIHTIAVTHVCAIRGLVVAPLQATSKPKEQKVADSKGKVGDPKGKAGDSKVKGGESKATNAGKPKAAAKEAASEKASAKALLLEGTEVRPAEKPCLLKNSKYSSLSVPVVRGICDIVVQSPWWLRRRPLMLCFPLSTNSALTKCVHALV